MANTVIVSTVDAGMVDEPLWMQATGGDAAINYSSTDDRAAISALIAAEGVILSSSTRLKVTQRGAGANFSVDIAVGEAVVDGDDAANQGRYIVRTTAVVNMATPAAPGSGTRVHRVIARIRDKQIIGSGTYDWTLELLEDTGTGTPAQPNSAITLALVSIASGQASVLNANITDSRPVAIAYGSQRVLARGNRAASSSTTTTEVGVLRLDSVFVPGGHIIRIATSGLALASSVVGDLVEARIRVNNAGTATTSSTLIGGCFNFSESSPGPASAGFIPAVAFYLPAANETISILLSVARTSGTGNVSILFGAAAYSPTIVVTDMGVDPGDSGVDI